MGCLDWLRTSPLDIHFPLLSCSPVFLIILCDTKVTKVHESRELSWESHTKESSRCSHLPWLLFWKVSDPEFVWLPVCPELGCWLPSWLPGGCSVAGMPWTTQQCSEWYWPVQNPTAQGARVQQRLLSWLVLEVALADFCPLFGWVDAMSRMCTWWWRWSSRSAWTVSATLHVLEWPLHQRIWRRFSWTTSSTSRSAMCWQSGPGILLADRRGIELPPEVS